MKTIAFLSNGMWCCILVERNGAETELFQAASVDEVYENLESLGLCPYYPHEFHAFEKLELTQCAS